LIKLLIADLGFFNFNAPTVSKLVKFRDFFFYFENKILKHKTNFYNGIKVSIWNVLAKLNRFLKEISHENIKDLI
jgi:hypothetical protein